MERDSRNYFGKWKLFWKIQTRIHIIKIISLYTSWSSKTAITSNALIWSDKVIDCIQIRFDGDNNKPIIDAINLILNSRCWQLSMDNNKDWDLEFPKEDNLKSSSSESNKVYQPLFTKVDSTMNLLTKQLWEPLKNSDIDNECMKMGFRITWLSIPINFTTWKMSLTWNFGECFFNKKQLR